MAPGWINLKVVFLVLLVVQNSSFTLLRRYSQGILKETYSYTSVIAVQELIKIFIAVIMFEPMSGEENIIAARTLVTLSPTKAGKRTASELGKCPCANEPQSHRCTLRERLCSVRRVILHGRAMAVPAFAYLVMNTISYVAMSYVDATTFTMVAQLKPLATCVFSKLVLGRSYSRTQWRSLVMLMLSVCIITIQRALLVASEGAPVGAATPPPSRSPSSTWSAAFVAGVSLVVLEVTISGWISTYFEKYLKDGQFSLWGRNIQLGVWTLAAMIPQEAVRIFASSKPNVDGDINIPPQLFAAENSTSLDMILSCFAGWSYITFALALLGSGGGLLVAVVTKHADAVTKAVAVSAAIILTVTAETLVLGTRIDTVVILAAGNALLAMESFRESRAQQASSKAVASDSTPSEIGTQPTKASFIEVGRKV